MEHPSDHIASVCLCLPAYLSARLPVCLVVGWSLPVCLSVRPWMGGLSVGRLVRRSLLMITHARFYLDSILVVVEDCENQCRPVSIGQILPGGLHFLGTAATARSCCHTEGAFLHSRHTAPDGSSTFPDHPEIHPPLGKHTCTWQKQHCGPNRAVLNAKKKKSRPEPGNFKRARGHSMCSTMVVAVGGWRLAAVGGWQLATGGWWRLVVVGGGWWLAVGGWRQLAVVDSWRLVAAGGWRQLVAGGWWRLVVGGWWRLAVDGSWRLAVGGPLGLSLRAVLSKKKKKSRSLRTPLGPKWIFSVVITHYTLAT